MSPSKKSPRSSGNEPEGNKPHISEANVTNATATSCVKFQPSQQTDTCAKATGCDRVSGRAGSLAASEKESKNPWYSPHTGTINHKLAELTDLREGKKTLVIYPHGVEIRGHPSLFSLPPVGTIRGVIEGFSDEAARNLREAFLKTHVLGFDVYAFSLTAKKIFTPNEWRVVMKRFRTEVKRAGWAGIWRVELQRRGAPHAHVAMSVPPGTAPQVVRDLWLQCTREGNDPAAREHAAKWSKIEQDEAGWVVYMAMHSGKHKEEQLGWLGKQWGIWNRALYVEREKLAALDFDRRQHSAFLRVLKNLENSKRRQHLGKLRRAVDEALTDLACTPDMVDVSNCTFEPVTGTPERYIIRDTSGNILGETTSLGIDVKDKPLAIWRSFKQRGLVRKMHRGNLLRLLSGVIAQRAAQGIADGTIYPVRPVRGRAIVEGYSVPSGWDFHFPRIPKPIL